MKHLLKHTFSAVILITYVALPQLVFSQPKPAMPQSMVVAGNGAAEMPVKDEQGHTLTHQQVKALIATQEYMLLKKQDKYNKPYLLVKKYKSNTAKAVVVKPN